MKDKLTRAVRWLVAVVIAFVVSVPVYISYASAGELSNPGCGRILVCVDPEGAHYFLNGHSIGVLTRAKLPGKEKSEPVAMMVIDTAGKKHLFAVDEKKPDVCSLYCVSGPF